MPLYSYKSARPELAGENFVAENATLIGDVKLGRKANIWFQTVVRADVNRIVIGANTNIQDLCMLHVTEERDLVLGENTSVGHSVTLHGCAVGDGCLIGMGATLLDGSSIGDNSLVAAGSVVPPRKEFPAGSMIMGSPARVVRKLSAEELDFVANHYKSYLGYAAEFMNPDIVKRL